MKLTLKIKQLGPVKNSELEWNPLTVFIGPNNTGKTYTAYLIYKFFKNFFWDSVLTKEETNRLFKEKEIIIDFERIEKSFISSFVNYFYNLVLPNFFKEFLKIDNNQPNLSIDFHFPKIRKRIFDFSGVIDIIGFERIGEADDEEEVDEFQIDKVVGELSFKIKGKIENKKVFLRVEDIDEIIFDEEYEELFYDYEDFYYLLTKNILNVLDFPKDAIIIPSERTAFLFHQQWFVIKDYFNVMLRKLKLLEIMEKDYSMKISLKNFRELLEDYNFPSYFEEYLQFLLLIDKKKKTKDFKNILKFLEEKLIYGKIVIDKGNFYYNFDKKKKILVHGASSSIKSLLPIEKFLSTASKNSLMVIDEPEMNLHPEAQVNLAIALAMAVNKGMYILMTTHSPYIVDTLTLLAWGYQIKHYIKMKKDKILLEEFKKSLKDGYFEIPENALLSPSILSTYFFNKNGIVEDIKTIKEIKNKKLEVDINWETFSKISDSLWEKFDRFEFLKDEISNAE